MKGREDEKVSKRQTYERNKRGKKDRKTRQYEMEGSKKNNSVFFFNSCNLFHSTS